MSEKRPRPEFDCPATVDSECAPVIDDAVVPEDKTSSRVENEPAPPADLYPMTDVNSAMQHAPSLGSRSRSVAPKPWRGVQGRELSGNGEPRHSTEVVPASRLRQPTGELTP